ncbi:MAG: hypothetical protein AAGE80_07975 [Pseudomonadota bacterium]
MVERSGSVDVVFGARKTRDLALILPIVGLLFLIPPFATIFAIEGRILGIPVMVAYIFTVWALLILASAILSWRIGRASRKDAADRLESTEEQPGGPVP